VFQVPDWTGNGALTYTLPLTNNWSSVSVIDYSYVGSSYSANNSPTEPRKRPAYRLLNARFAVSHGATELALVGKNLTNEVTNLADNRSIAAEVPGRPRLFLNQPRTIGIEVTQRF
jgi:outer membrane receptor protein involved in Fe transport